MSQNVVRDNSLNDMADAFRKLYLLVWKNFKLQIRRPIGTVVEIVFPLTMLALLVLARQLTKDEEKCLSSFQSLPLQHQSFIDQHKTLLKVQQFKITYWPINDNTTKLLQHVSDQLNISLTTVSSAGTNFTSKQQVIDETSEFVDYLGAVIFENVITSDSFPKVVDYSIRMHHSMAKQYENVERNSWFTKWVYPLEQEDGPRTSTFYLSPFIALQYALDSAIIQFFTNNNSLTSVGDIQQLPYPDYVKDPFISVIQQLMPFIFIIGFTYTAMTIVKELVAEKQLRLKESMKMMGLPNWVHWTAWFIKIFLFLLISIILQTILLKVSNVIKYTNGGVLFVFLLLYFIAAMFSLFFISALFSKAVIAMLATLLLWIGSLGPYLSFASAELYEEMSGGNKFATCLLPNSCLGIVLQIISRREKSRVGVDWQNINEKTSIDDNFVLAEAFWVFVLDCFIFGILTWYIENVFPGEFGVPRPFYFPFQRSYWCGSSNTSEVDGGNNHDLKEQTESNPNIETEPSDIELGVVLNNLTKVFTGSTGTKVAVDGLSLNIYKGQITALLGHNGAGKTTTMSMLTGLFQPTSGSAHINGHSIATEMDKIRESLGLCPQHNVLFDRMTVKEHLQFYSTLKGVSEETAEAEIAQMLQDIQLVDKANQQSRTLSGGMKRKLCCGIALIGGSETVFLDEPTSGMDPYARRATWDLLQRYRANKTIILTTHFMDEADYLGDRIAIMADGQLRCCGSSLFLKKRYGVGYHMTLVKGPNFENTKTTSLISESIPTSKLVGNIGTEMTYILQEETTNQFKPLFQALEEHKEEYGIDSFGISVTTMEEVFLKVGEGETVSVEKIEEEKTEDKAHLHKLRHSESMIQKDALLTGYALKATQFKAMFVKRFLNSKRTKIAVLSQVLVPLLLVLCGFLLSISRDTQKDDEKRVLSLSMLKDKADTINAFYSDFSSKTDMEKTLLKKISSNVFSEASVNLVDHTNESIKIQIGNQGQQISLFYTSKTFSANISSSRVECCKYKYLLLNAECRKINPADFESLCGKSPPDFGYKQCMKCISPSVDPKKCGATPTLQRQDTMKASQMSFQEYILEDSGRDVRNYFHKNVAGFSTENDSRMTVWYSNQGLHALPSAFSAGSNIVLKYHTNDLTYGIVTNNYPLPRNTDEKKDTIKNNNSNLSLIIFITMGAAMIASSFITFLVTEKTSKAKHIQFVSGVDSISYWGATFCWDFINYMVPALGIFILFAAFNLDDYDGELGAVFLVLILFGFSVLPFIYCLSFVFKSALIAYAVISSVMALLSLALVIAVFICRSLDEDDIADIIHYIFLIFPTYAFPQALTDISSNVGYKRTCTVSEAAKLRCAQTNIKYHNSSLAWSLPGIGIHCLYMFLEGCTYFLLVLLIEENFFISHIFKRKKIPTFSIREGEDEDVRREREKVFNMNDNEAENSALVIKDLTKVYRSTGMMAVDHLNVDIPKAECFGLLGVNGAGKTTTFGMLTGELGITDGTACVLGYDIQTNPKDVQQRIGYCPQFDGLIEKLTGREMLRMFAQLRGIPAHLVEEVVNATVNQLNLKKWADKLCGDYSGGNKRKLSTAMALVGEPEVVFLDEPTSGMDPATRRYLWNTLISVLNDGRSIVLTSHSMEECEALCTRLVVMVNGQFKCIGSVQHLKSKYGKGYTIMMKVSGEHAHNSQDTTNGVNNVTYKVDSDNATLPQNIVAPSSPSGNNKIDRIKQFMNEQFPGALLIEDRQNLLQYQVLESGVLWSQMFDVMESNVARLGITDYSVSQTSLDQVFINFAKHQHSEDRIIKPTRCSCSCF